jgi:hypothetical protein
MAWVGTALGLFAGTVLFGRGRNFVLSASLSGFALLGALNLSNPDALIARTNITRFGGGVPVDVYFLGFLSDDAVPSLLDRAHLLSDRERCELFETLTERRTERRTDWRSWNIGRHRASLTSTNQQVATHMIGCSRSVR